MNQKPKVLILGGNGFIGSNLTRRLATSGCYKVSCFDCTEPNNRIQEVQYLTGDFFDDNYLEQMVREHDIIYHAISTLTPGNSNERYMQGYAGDFVQSVKLCDYVQKAGKKLIFLSSGGTVYGKHENIPIKEDASCDPINHYGTIKRCIEIVMSTFREQNRARMIVARISNPYGPGQDYRKGVGVIDAALKNAIHGETMTIWGDGEIIRDYIYIDDVCGMLEALATYEGSEVFFNLSSGVGHSVNEVLGIVKKDFPKLKVVYQAGRSVDLQRIILDNSKIKELYIQPIVTLEEGIKRYRTQIEKDQ